MISFLLFLFVVYDSHSTQMNPVILSSLTLSTKHFSSKNISKSDKKKLSSENNYVCTATCEISEKNFENTFNIKSEIGCQSIIIVKCIFNSISVPENSQSDGSISIINIKSSDLSIEDCNFLRCSSSNRLSPSFPISHIVFVEENPNNDIYITSCNFLDNGYESDPDGTIILINNANNIQISFTQFKSEQRFSSSIHSFYTKNVNLTENIFNNMVGPIDQNGGALSIQFSENISISDCVFDSNNLQQKSENKEVLGSAFYLNLDGTFSFSNNTIKNHVNFINSVVTFNSEENDHILIRDSSFIGNSYTKSVEVSGIGFYSESSQNSDGFHFLNTEFVGCVFSRNGDVNRGEIGNSAGVFDSSRNGCCVSFKDCIFDGNFASSESALINVQNGYFVNIDSCTIKGILNYCLLKFSPLKLSENEYFEVRVANTSIANADLTGRKNGDLILIDGDTQFNSSLTVIGCTFTDISLSEKNSIVHTACHELHFLNNTMRSCSTNGVFIDHMCSVFIDGCTFTQCSSSAIKYIPQAYDETVNESVIIQNCDFIECSGYSCVAYLSPFISRPKFFNLNISNSIHNFAIVIEMKPLTIAMNEAGEVLLQNVSFFNTHPIETAEECGGGGCGFLYKTESSDEDRVTFTECFFERTFSSIFGGGAILIQGDTCLNYHVEILSCHFSNCYTNANKGGAIAVETNKSVQIENCYFESCGINNNEYHDFKGGAIFVNQKSGTQSFCLINNTFNGTQSTSDYSAVDFECSGTCPLFLIENCTFKNCKTTCYLRLPYSIISCPINVQYFECINSIFEFDDKSIMNPRVALIEASNFSFDNCNFIRCGSKIVNEGGCIYYEGIQTTELEKISIQNCYFLECEATNSAIFKLKLSTLTYPTFYNITIKGIRSDYSIYISFKVEFRGTVLFDNLKFIENVNCLDGGGSGIWLNNLRDEFNIYTIHSAFSHCDFINNYSPNNGGGYGLGYDELVKPTHLTFTDCNFIGNHCDGSDGGGALWIRTSTSCTLAGCLFQDNYASYEQGSNGGAIYISFASNMVYMTMLKCEFRNNSCLHSNSRGHAIYATLLYARMEISRSKIIDNGIDNDIPNSMIYSRSELFLIENSIYYTDKERSFSRAVYSGASANLALRYNTIANCSILASGGALCYESIKSKAAGRIEIIGNTFINNSGLGKGPEIYLYAKNTPTLYNCSFINESTSTELICIKFDKAASISRNYDRFYFINCHFNYTHFISQTPENIEEDIVKKLRLYDCRYISCSKIPLFFQDAYSLELTKCIFENNVNDGFFITINNIAKSALLSSCQFRNNKLSHKDLTDESDLAIINVSQVPITIRSTIFENENINDVRSDTFNSFLVKIDSDSEFDNVSFINCLSPKYAIFYDQQSENGSFTMTNCSVNNSGSVLLNDWTQQVKIINSSFSNSIDGFLYMPNKKVPDNFVSDFIQFKNNVFDGFTNFACLLLVLNDIDVANITIKNNQKLNENNLPIFEIDLRNSSINDITIDHFTFENNKYNNKEGGESWMNGGGTGFVVNLNLIKGKEKEVFLSFVDCKFISNEALNHGGAFAFIETKTNERTTFLSFDNCFFKENRCSKQRGNALYLFVKNVTIANCVFESNSNNESTPNEEQSSVYLYFDDLKDESLSDSFSLINCSFIKNECCSMHFDNCTKRLFVTNCSFYDDGNKSLLISNCEKEITIFNSSFVSNNGHSLLIENCSQEVMILNSLFISNKDNSLQIYDCLKEVTLLNSTFSGNKNCSLHLSNIDSNLSILHCSFENNQEKSLLISNCHSIFSITSCTFSNNNENSILIYECSSNMSVTDCSFSSNKEHSMQISGSEMNISLMNCIFMNNSDYSLHISDTINFLSIESSQFESNSAYAIYVSDCLDRVIVSECSFSFCQMKSICIERCGKDICIQDSTFESTNKYTEPILISVKTNSSLLIRNVSFNGDDSVFHDHSISCFCKKSFMIENVMINKCGGIQIDPNSSMLNGLTVINTTIKNSEYGLAFNPMKESTITIVECTFSSVKHALQLSLMSEHFTLRNNTICDCNNLDENEEKESIISISLINSSEKNFVIENFLFKENKYFLPKTKKSGFGGGIGMSIKTAMKMSTFNLEFKDCIFTANKALKSGSGGALYYVNQGDETILSSFSICNCNFTRNEAEDKGGALFIETVKECSILIKNCWFEINEALIDGGGVYVKNGGYFTIDSSRFINNSALLTKPSSSLIPSDALAVFAHANVRVVNSLFIKLSYPKEESNVQTMFSIVDDKLFSEVSIVIEKSVYSVINPSKSIVALQNPNINGEINIKSTSFTRFYLLNTSKLTTQSPSDCPPLETPSPNKEETKTFSDKEEAKAFSNKEETKAFSDKEETKAFSNKEETKAFSNKEETKAFSNKEETKAFSNKEEAKAFSDKEETKAFSNKEEAKAFSDKEETKAFSDKEQRLLNNKYLDEMSDILNASRSYVHIFINDDLSGKINIDNSCFDTDDIYSFDRERIGISSDGGASNSASDFSVTVRDNDVSSTECEHPLILDDLIDQNSFSTPTPARKPKSNNNKLLIFVTVGVVFVVVIIAVVVVIVIVRKKKKEEKIEKMKREAEKEKEMSVEVDAVNNNVYGTQSMTQENPLFTYTNVVNTVNIEYEEDFEKVQTSKDGSI